MKMICEVASCGEELTEGTGSKGGPMLCKWCRGPRSYWNKKPLAARRERFGRLALFRSRMEYYDPRVAEIVNEAQKSVANTRKRAQAAHSTHH
jgi:hypothetical protein